MKTPFFAILLLLALGAAIAGCVKNAPRPGGSGGGDAVIVFGTQKTVFAAYDPRWLDNLRAQVIESADGGKTLVTYNRNGAVVNSAGIQDTDIQLFRSGIGVSAFTSAIIPTYSDSNFQPPVSAPIENGYSHVYCQSTESDTPIDVQILARGAEPGPVSYRAFLSGAVGTNPTRYVTPNSVEASASVNPDHVEFLIPAPPAVTQISLKVYTFGHTRLCAAQGTVTDLLYGLSGPVSYNSVGADYGYLRPL